MSLGQTSTVLEGSGVLTFTEVSRVMCFLLEVVDEEDVALALLVSWPTLRDLSLRVGVTRNGIICNIRNTQLVLGPYFEKGFENVPHGTMRGQILPVG